MLVKLLPEQIVKYWDEIASTIIELLPPISIKNDESLVNILESMMKGEMDCFLIMGSTYEDKKIYGIITTTLQEDACSGNLSLLIYTLNNVDTIPVNVWKDMQKTLIEEAKAKKCSSISFYTNNNDIVDFVSNNFDASSMVYVTVPINE